MVSFAGVKCGKGKFIGISPSLFVLSVGFLEVKAESLAESHCSSGVGSWAVT